MVELQGYTNKEKLHHSGNSIVFRAVNEQTKLAVVLKFFNKEYPSPDEIKAYEEEFRIPKNVEHILGVNKSLEFLPYQNTFVIVMEDIGGVSLDKILVERKFPVKEFLSIATNITQTLQQIHKAGVIHKDLNPNNIIYNPESKECKIIDFSLSTLLTKEHQGVIHPDKLEGTLQYISPEQTGRMNRSIDYRSDFYSLGVAFYEMLTGQVPFDSNDTMELVHSHIARIPKPVSEINSSIPEVISKIILKLIEKNAENRYQSTSGLLFDLKKCQVMFQKTGTIEDFEIAKYDISERFQIPEKLYGREDEIKIMLDGFQKSSDGQKQILFVGGEPGIGKSALINELNKFIVSKRANFIRGKYEQYQRNVPYFGIIQSFREMVQQLLTQSDSEISKWKNRILEAVGNNGQVIVDVIPEVELIIGKQPQVQDLPPTESQNRFNRVFQNFVKSFAQPESSLVLFIDDLQWADSASLKLLEVILSDIDLTNFYFIGAYRDNEVNALHSFILMLDDLKKREIDWQEFKLSPLNHNAISELISETLFIDTYDASELTDLILAKTAGNPFFINRFLKNLYHDNLIVFNKKWIWDIEKIKNANITDNVIELMAGMIMKLPEETLSVLKTAACIGVKFRKKILLTIHNKTEDEIDEALFLAFNGGMVISEAEYIRFVHDRVQEATYMLIEDDDKQKLHYKIGKKILENIADTNVFNIAYQLNTAKKLLTDEERKQSFDINIKAGEKAKASNAYSAAVVFCHHAADLISVDAWEKDYDNTLHFYTLWSEVEYLSRNFEKADELFEVVLKYAENILDKAPVHTLKVNSLHSQMRTKESLDAGCQALELLGVSIPDSVPDNFIELEMKEIERSLRGRKVESLIDAPVMTDPEKIHAINIIMHCVAPAYQTNPALMLVFNMRIVDLALKYGNTEGTDYAYALFGGIILCGILNDFDTGAKYLELAIKLTDKYDNFLSKGKVYYLYGVFTHFHKHIREGKKYLTDGFNYASEAGDLQYSTYCATIYGYSITLLGEELQSVESEFDKYSPEVYKFGQIQSSLYHNVWRQTICNLLGKVDNLTVLTGEFLDEEYTEKKFLDLNDYNGLGHFYAAKLFLSYIYGEYQQAYKIAQNEGAVSNGLLGQAPVQTYYTLYALSITNLYTEASNDEKVRYDEKLQAIIPKLKIWGEGNQYNYLHKYKLVLAEQARIKNEPYEDVIILYEDAISGAKKYAYVLEEGIANELLSKYLIQQGKTEEASKYMLEARYAFQKWGCKPKVEMLEKQYPEFFLNLARGKLLESDNIERKKSTKQTATSRVQSLGYIDMVAIIKASQNLSKETDMKSLLKQMIRLMVENAGAEKGVFILPSKENWFVGAVYEIAFPEQDVLTSIPLEASRLLSNSIVRYVIKTKTNLVLENATKEGLFTKDNYVLANQPKSVICFPIVKQGILIAILYLENNLAESAFTQKSIETLKILASQAAISIENAKLIENLEEKVKERTISLEKEKEKAEAANQAKSVFLANMSHELRTPLNAVLGFSDILYSKEIDATKKRYLNSVMASGKALLSLINDVLDLSKIEAGKVEVMPSDVSIRNIFSEIETIFAQKTAEKDVELTINVAHDIPEMLIIDQVRLRQILLNLVSNALKFTDSGSVKINCEKYTEEDTPKGSVSLKIRVADTGCGIKPSDLNRIFNAFEQAEGQSVTKYGGTGLGLAISQNLASLMNGEIRVESELEKGSVFTLIIKQIEIGQRIDDKIPANKLINPENVTFDKAHILIVDDIDYNLDMMEAYLKSYGFDLSFAKNGKEALNQIELSKPDLVLLDLKMPVMDGYELAEILRSKKEYKDLSIVAITASALKQDEERIKKHCNSFVNKPVSRAQIITEISNFIKHSVVDTKQQESFIQQYDKDAIPNKKVLEELYGYAIYGDMEGICDYIDVFVNNEPQYSYFGNQIKKLAEACKDTAIIDTIDENLRKRSAPKV